ncbi:RagB/SusD family nutrient uptake outer membrane protein [Pedobacter sp. MC2016-14]|uniref:RagB/SusD family nutrient uptake outer membrane protein n=1 Tax=Pedobacter sp. MC2016-14 TaxID=2897327 RepID=UPI001E3A0CE8|nr:RagB/SusD family nutrient uptake outer membrane protein [Pedobacter sp. MC2016-14]MCD0489693.1 RagB/SusD family nutrient uptake outer membrane protein [Pedobacter sp. MC2016-14]
MKGKITFLGAIVFVLTNISCTKSFLDAKPNTDITQPITLDEFQKLLDNTTAINRSGGLAILSCDEFQYSSDALWSSAPTATARNSYIWTKDLYEGEIVDSWNIPYTSIFYANNVIEGLSRIEISTVNTLQWNNIKGWALFVRAYAYYELVSNFAPVYDSSNSSRDLAVPLRLKPSIDELLPRASVTMVYNQILEDLNEAVNLLDLSLPIARSRPSKIAANALLSKIYLSMRNYEKAEIHADACLSSYSKLIDYNLLSKTAAAPFPRAHDEQIYAKSAVTNQSYITRGTSSGANTYIQITSEVLGLYEPNDLRKTIYFVQQTDGSYDLKQGYFGPGLNPFTGLATDEVLLIKAECLARRGEITTAMDKLDQLRIKRWSPNATSPAKAYQNLIAADPVDALAKVLLERRRELVWRGVRWDDLKRFNKEGANISISRSVNGQLYTLLPNSNRYIFPIPDDEISLSGISQNER